MVICGTPRTFAGSCPDCSAEQAEQLRVRETQRRHEERLAVRERAGVPRRYLYASLESFKVRLPEQQAVHDTARQFLENPFSFGTGLLFLGPCGTGKTLLACAIVNHLLSQGRAAYFGTTLEIIQQIRASWSSRSTQTEEETFRRFTRPDLLVVDEIGQQHGTDNERILLGELLNCRYSDLKPTIMAGNITVAEFQKTVGERALDRFREGGRVLVFNWPSYRTEAGKQIERAS